MELDASSLCTKLTLSLKDRPGALVLCTVRGTLAHEGSPPMMTLHQLLVYCY